MAAAILSWARTLSRAVSRRRRCSCAGSTLGVIILFAAATIIFALQNFEIITMSVFGFDARVPLAVLVAVAYLLGAATGGSLFALLRRSYQGSRRRVVGAP